MMLMTLFLGTIVIWRGIWVQKLALRWKIIISLPLAVIAGKFYVLRVFGGKYFAPELPAPVLLVFAWCYAVMVLFCMWLVLYEVVSAAVRWISFLRKKSLCGFFRNPLWRCVVLPVIVILVSIGMYEGIKVQAVREYTIELRNLPDRFDGMRIVHLSDIHADPLSDENKIAEIVRLANSQQADLIVITGDFVDGRAAVRGKELAHLGKLYAPMGVFGVPGNHEYYSGYDEWIKFLNDNGVEMLENRHVMLAENFALGGVTDLAAERMQKESPDIVKTFAAVPPGAFKLLLAHQPKLAAPAAENGVDLTLSGHTHGGMVWGLDLLVSIFNNGLISGLYDVGDMKLFISNGTGIWSGFPIRLGHPSEIVVLTLKKL